MIKSAIIGCGNIFTMHVTSVSHFDDVELVAVCDIKKDRADKQAEKYKCKAYYDYKKMAEEEKLDVVHICLPHYLHPIVSKYFLSKGVNVICEKPMAIMMKDAFENVSIAEEKKVQYGIIFQCRYNESSRFVKKIIESGELGKIISARVVLTWSKPDEYYLLSDWKGTWDKEGGGVIIDQAIHSLDLANWFINDEIKEVRASLHNYGHNIMEVDDTGEGLITYKNGAKLCFYAMNNYGCDEPIEIRLYCEKGKVKMNYDEAEVIFNNGKKQYLKNGSDGISYENGKDYWGFQHIKQLRQFYNAVEGKENLEISGKEALKIQKLICEIYKKATIK